MKILLIWGLATSCMFAQASRTWVSGVGDDANPCSRYAPCKTFAGAISKTVAGGEIDVLDPGSFGPVTITKSITLAGGSEYAGILASGINGIVVNAPAGSIVTLRNLALHGFGTGQSGIRFLQGGSLIVEDCTIDNFLQNAIDVEIASSAVSSIIVRNTEISGVAAGIRLRAPNAPTGALTVSASHIAIRNSAHGVWASYGNTTVTEAVLSQLSGTGLWGDSTAKLYAANSLVAGNAVGVKTEGSSTVLLSNNDIVDNAQGFSCAVPATIRTAANNRTAGNLGGGQECPLVAGIGVQ